MSSSLKNFLPEKGELFYVESFIEPDLATSYFNTIKSFANWRQDTIKIFGKEVLQPRLVAWHADPDVDYGYSGKRLTPGPWSRELLEIKNQVEHFFNSKFNSALLNLYRNGSDSMGWHRDNEKELGKNPVIASVSLGESRRFLIREKENKKSKLELNLGSGSLVVMAGECQSYWEHSVPKTAKEKFERINITFRDVKSF